MRSILFLLISSLLYFLSAAQNKGYTISGSVTDKSAKPVAGATIILSTLPDSTLVKTVASSEDGKFRFKKLQPAQYFLTVTSIGFKKFLGTAITADSTYPNLEIPVIALESTGQKMLQEVIVTSNKPLIEKKVDRTIVNVEAMIGAVGSNLLEVLAKSPGVMIDINGDINLNGKAGILVLIDGRSTYLSAQDLAAYLRSLPATLVDKIELMSNPPSKYDASGSAVINLQLKKNKAPGFNGNVSAGYTQGKYAGSNEALNFNYRSKKYSLFSNFSYNINKGFNDDDAVRVFYNNDQSLREKFIINNYTVNSSQTWNGRTAIDYYASPKTTTGLQLMANTRPGIDNFTNTNIQYDGNGQSISGGYGQTIGSSKWKSGGLNLNLQHRFNTDGKTLNADLDIISYQTIVDQQSYSNKYIPGGSIITGRQFKFATPSEIAIYSLKIDYTQPLKKNIRLDAGVKTSYVSNDNNSQWFNWQNNFYIPDYNQSNHFVYNENINALYASGTKEGKRWSIQGGLRAENVQLKGHLIGNGAVKDSSFSRNYTNLFPTLFIFYKLDSAGNHTLKLSYERRIRRPNYQQLNPFVQYRDPYSYTAGNPNLKPHYNNFIELEYGYKQFFGVSVMYGHLSNIIQPLTKNVNDTFITRPGNFGINYSFNIVPHISFSPLKGWTLNAGILYFHLVNKGNAYGQAIINTANSVETSMNNQFKFKKGWSAEVSGFYANRHTGGQTITEPFWMAGAALQKSIQAGKLVVRLGIDDIFYTREFNQSIIGLPQAAAYRTSRSDSRRGKFSFSYRFGKDYNNRKKNHDANGAADEKSRAN